MANTVFDLFVRIGADLSGLSAGLNSASAQVTAAGQQMSQGLATATAGLTGTGAAATSASQSYVELSRQARGLATIGALVSGAFAVPTLAIKESVSAFADFDAALTKSLAIQENVSASMRQNLAAAAIELSTNISISAKDAAASFYFLASAGLSVEQQIAALPVAANFAKAGLVSVNDATQILTRTQNALGLSSKDAALNLQNMTLISDLLVKADTVALEERRNSRMP